MITSSLYQRTLANEKFLIFDSGKSEDSRVIVFATQRNLELLKKNPVFGILMVHFKVSIFTQAFTILGTRERQRNVEYQGIVPLPIGSCCPRRQQSIHLFYKQ